MGLSGGVNGTSRREAPMPPLEGEVPNECEAEGFARTSTERFKETPQSARSGCQLPFQGRRGRFAPMADAIRPYSYAPGNSISWEQVLIFNKNKEKTTKRLHF